MVFGSTMLEVAIGMIFVYLLLSLLCSAFSEFIELLFKFRARDLEKGIKRLLNNPALAQQFFAHPLVKPLFNEGRKPSYIPARTFSLALWNLATSEAKKAPGAVAGVTEDLKLLRATVASLPETTLPNDIKSAVVTLMDEAGDDFNKARANIEEWYNDAMDRVSGWYKRRTHWILLGLGLFAAIVLNVDSIMVLKALSQNDALRASVVSAAEDYAKNNPAPGATPAPVPAGTTQDQAAASMQKINQIRGEINQLDLPIGWPHEPQRDDPKYKNLTDPQFKAALVAYDIDPRRMPVDPYGMFLKVLGFMLTALAVSQGAPFWFDVLNKFIVIRSTVKPHEKSREQPSKDRPAPQTTKQQTRSDDDDAPTAPPPPTVKPPAKNTGEPSKDAP
ncbi:MAG: hypothetical protein LC754_09680 [Acidobacteria bacterium]|nr:hypothetical protein [Acidobacteriota bacterium]